MTISPRPSVRAILINTAIPILALLLILLLTSFAYRSPRTDSLVMNKLRWLTPPVGMYTVERTPDRMYAYRWTSSEATLPLPNPGGAVILQLVMAGHPGGTTETELHVGHERIPLTIPAVIRRYRLLVPPVVQERLSLQFRAVPVVIEGDGRPLGVMVGPVQIFGGGRAPDEVLFGAALLFIGGYLFARQSGYTPWAISSALLLIIAPALLWNAAFGWRYASVGSSMLLMAALSFAALAYEQLYATPDGFVRAARPSFFTPIPMISAMILMSVGLPLVIIRTPDLVMIGAALVAVASYIWLRAVGLPTMIAYAGMLLLGVAALLAQYVSSIVPLVTGLLLTLFSTSWLALEFMPRAQQKWRTWVTNDIAWLVLSAVIVITIGIHLYLWLTPVKKLADIGFIWRDSVRLVGGENPYARVIGSNMRTNDKYATYFPLFYVLGALVHLSGLQTFESWTSFWRIVFLGCDIGTALLIYSLLIRSGRVVLASGASAFWLLHRWTLSSAISVNIDFLAIFFLTLSLVLLHLYWSPAAHIAHDGEPDQPPRPQWLFWGSLVSLSLSLAVKQIGIFLVPLYCIWAWHISRMPLARAPRSGWRQTRVARTAIAILVILGIPLLMALPFLAWNAPGFVLSILFSATRGPSPNSLVDISLILGRIFPSFTGITSRLIVILLLLAVYAATARREVQIFTAGLLTMAAFVGFNPVFFNQYLTWLLPFIALIACDYRTPLSPDEGARRGRPPLPPGDESQQGMCKVVWSPDSPHPPAPSP